MFKSLLLCSSVLTVSPTMNIVVQKTQNKNENPSLFTLQNDAKISNLSQNERKNNVEYRLYLDSTNDTLSPEDNKIDYNLGYLAKDKWYDVELPLIQYNFSDFATNNKYELISKIGSKIELKYYYAFNMWDSKLGWRYSEGKNVPLKWTTSDISLRPEEHTEQVQYEMSGTDTEAGRIEVQQKWDSSGLKINVKMGVWYHWAWGSIYNHATLTKFSLDKIEGNNSNINLDNKTEPVFANMPLSIGTHYISLDSLFDKARNIFEDKIKNSWKMVAPTLVSYTVSGFCNSGNQSIYATINALNYSYLLNDISLTMISGSLLNGKIVLENSQVGSQIRSSLYYKNINNALYFMGQASSKRISGCNNISLIGLESINYIYMSNSI
ncbi:hypothetical protein [Williamsoniiplasma lucivorax]|uniref:Uncharacterized protein n=1 Tax=Williamsoniiplasma lucivorax TaxID=209274 RepID=A0A2S5RFP6_9MOLU|nr:hypothetical protein [Williamsoniiplasma lucivorax]PPE06121.1 hypothetical protein ELUCI_v1c04120 [Williamsoniiplasma lucivorax]